MTRKISILGVTGSIGLNAADIIKRNSHEFEVVAVTAQNNADGLIEIARNLKPKFVAIENEAQADKVKESIDCELISGNGAAEKAAKIETDITLSAIVGIAGLKPSLAAIPNTKTLALANKESLVCAGRLLMDLCESHNTKILPVDSEHNSIFQIMQGRNFKDVKSVTLTASGGPFRGFSGEQLKNVSAKDAVKHPNWNMGAKISVDSATLLNKGLEMIEAYHLFPINARQIEMVVHPESIIHSFVNFVDGSSIAQSYLPDMQIPISHCIFYPDSVRNTLPPINFAQIKSLNFHQPDLNNFKCLKLATDILNNNPQAGVVLNAANEVAVDMFLKGEINFLEIAEVIARMVDSFDVPEYLNIEEVFDLDSKVRREIKQYA